MVENKVVLVTGGRRGLGAAIVDEVLSRGARKVYSTARQPFEDPRAQVIPQQLEVASESSVRALARELTDVEIVVNNAGVLHPDSLLTGDLDRVDATFQTNVFGPLRVIRAFAPILKANGGGAIINIHSVLSWLGGAGAYGASKAAIWSVTNTLRLELEPQHTHVLGVHAGFIDTDMVSALDVPKTPPGVIAARIIDALEKGDNEVLTDELTAQVKSQLSGPVENLAYRPGH
ncbi:MULTISPECIES: SDR family oxidoreductase [Mycobacteroides]|jgi:NAD(P)-dependent dehydrogenase (short-subunit alcohol dehydrogenase family)|uniref:Short-chain dehydrogenase n=1 Tax=Mycobacteroides chelonae TaxID=1774 RepID=A0AB73MKB4_MYCCH|nr:MULTISPECIES: SDR family oxidoreductase [Mycobacteroides]KRQ28889.1 short-chain dehydrogenase [Mycobacteroides sp. H072]KRQ38648.1 short-chain dehydrogenase [Mycobacteroides sp. H002]KRQ48926.1 short-chain dehydrogenase [Mycobacteroides sp. H054]KRQ71624.1 short-chain dehydrogenase [Mycobacteroides sp. H001]MBF9329496.1 SDR family oxidoreductase [Mycobacteroides chelonae]